MKKIPNIINELPGDPSGYRQRTLDQITGLVVHCTDGTSDTPQSVAAYHTSPGNHISANGCPAIAYTVFIMPDGEAYQTLPFESVGWHVGKTWNGHLAGITLAYRATGNNKPPSDAQYFGLVQVLAKTALYLDIEPKAIVGHRELFGTGWGLRGGRKYLMKECPGMKINLDVLRKSVTIEMQTILGVSVDGIWGPQSREAAQSLVMDDYNA